jgi:hypothetical protein
MSDELIRFFVRYFGRTIVNQLQHRLCEYKNVCTGSLQYSHSPDDTVSQLPAQHSKGDEGWESENVAQRYTESSCGTRIHLINKSLYVCLIVKYNNRRGRADRRFSWVNLLYKIRDSFARGAEEKIRRLTLPSRTILVTGSRSEHPEASH